MKEAVKEPRIEDRRGKTHTCDGLESSRLLLLLRRHSDLSRLLSPEKISNKMRRDVSPKDSPSLKEGDHDA